MTSLAAPALLVGACSGGSGEGDGSGGAESPVADGAVRAPEVTDDGRILQPAGHEGIWFETEPDDPLEHLVWASQKYVGQMLEVEDLGAEAYSSEFSEMKNVCSSEVESRMGKLGLETLDSEGVDLKIGICSFSDSGGDLSQSGRSLIWGATKAISVQDIDPSRISGVDSETFLVDRGEMAKISGCLAVRNVNDGDHTIFSGTIGLAGRDSCGESELAVQVMKNILGGDFSV